MAGFEAAIVKAFRKRMQLIRAAVDERTFYAMKSRTYDKPKGTRDGQRSIRLNDPWRLVLRLHEVDAGTPVLGVSTTDYHSSSQACLYDYFRRPFPHGTAQCREQVW